MSEKPGSSRRAFLKGSAALAPVVVLATDLAGAQEKPAHDDLLGSDPGPGHVTHPGYQPSFFTPAEWAFVCAACDRLIPRDETGPGALELGVPEYIDRQMQTPYAVGERWYMQAPFIKAEPEFGYQSKLTPRDQYRLGARAMDDYCRKAFGKTFAELDIAHQDATLKAMENGDIKDAFNLKGFFTGFLLKNTMEGYFGDPMYGGNKDMGSWKMIGYPGVRGDYKDWVTQYGRRYPYGPVSLHGRQA